MNKCEICGTKARKRIVVGQYALPLCNRCARDMEKEIKKQTFPFAEQAYSGPKGSLLDMMQHDEALEAMMEHEPDALLCLWMYPHGDWELAVSTGITNLASYRELEDRIESAKATCRKAGRPVIVIEKGVQELIDLLASEGLENTSANRMAMISRLGIEAYLGEMDE